MIGPSRLALVVLLGLVVHPLSVPAQEWTRFRGPNGSGLSDTSFPAHFTENDFAWSVTLPGTGHSSPVVWGDKLFLTCTDEATAQRMIVCISTKTGAVEWNKDYGSHSFKHHGDNSYASSTPAVDGSAVYVCWNTPEEFTLVALNHSGGELWKTSLGPVLSQHGSGNSPILIGDLVILGDEQDGPSFLFGLDRSTGKILWKTPRTAAKYAYGTPVVFHPASGPDQVVFTSQAEGMTGIDPLTGTVLWQAAGIFDSRTVGSPAVGKGLIFGSCGEGPGGHVLVAVRPPQGKDLLIKESKPAPPTAAPSTAPTTQPVAEAQVVWKVKAESPYVPTPLVKGDLLYYWNDRGTVTCADAASGKIVWQHPASEPPTPPGSFFCSPICAGNMLFNVSKKGEVVALAAGEKFAVLGRTPLNDKCHATPAISGGRMYIRTYSHLFCIKGTGGQASR